jgi:transcriptional regulator with XRE-family HTH domain
MVINDSRFSENLIRIRKLKGLSQKDLANTTGISARMIYHYENHVSHPAMEKIEIIAKALKVSVSELIGLESNKVNNSELENFESLNVKTIKQLKKILKLNRADRSQIYKMVDLLLQKEEYKDKLKELDDND